MKALLRLIPNLLVCCFISVIIAIPSYMLLMVRLVNCAMSLGCSGTASSIFDVLAPVGLLAPLIIFPFGAYLSRNTIYTITPSSFKRASLFATFSFFPIIVIVAVQAYFSITRSLYTAKFLRHQQLERALKQVPVEITVLQAQLIQNTNDDGLLKLTIQINNIPDDVPSYKVNLVTFDTIRPQLFWIDLSDRVHPTHVTAIREDNIWRFKADHTKQDLTSGNNTFTTTVYFRRIQATPEQMPKSVMVSLTALVGGSNGYLKDVDVFFNSVPLPLQNPI